MIFHEKQDLTFLKWSHIRSSSGTAGSFLKSESKLNKEKIYYKLSNYNSLEGITGHECVNEIIVARLLTILGVEHLEYDLIYADIEVENKTYTTYLCASTDFKQKGENKIALDDLYIASCKNQESHYEFCKRMQWQKYIDTMIAIDYIILNRDRHGANIEVLRNPYSKTLRIAPLFDHGLSLLYSCHTDEEAVKFDILEDKKCNNFIGGYSCYNNIKLIENRKSLFLNKLKETDKDIIFEGLDSILSDVFIDKIWQMIYERYQIYENL